MPWLVDEQGNHKGLDSDYLKYRFELFDKYTVPSICNQTNKNFKWFVIYDKRTPHQFHNKILSYGKLPFYEPVFVEPGFSLKTFVDKLICDERYYYVTSRLDNDDALMPDYVELVQKKAREALPKDKYITSIRNYRYDVNERTLTTYKMKKNHFISRIGNVYEWAQYDMPVSPLAYVKISGTHCVEIIHEKNVLNSTKYTFRGVATLKDMDNIKKTLGLDLLEPKALKKYSLLCAKNNYFHNCLITQRKLVGILYKYLSKVKK